MRKLLMLGAAALSAAAALPFIARAQVAEAPRPPVFRAEPAPRPVEDPYRLYDVDERFDDEPGRAVPLLDPREVGAMTQAMDRLVGAVLDLPVGGIAAAIDPMGRGDIRPGDTVRDMAGRDDPYLEERLRGSIHGSARSVNTMARALARLMPELERSIAEVERSLDEALPPRRR